MEQTMIDHPNWCKVAEVELFYKTKIKASERPQIKSGIDPFFILKPIITAFFMLHLFTPSCFRYNSWLGAFQIF